MNFIKHPSNNFTFTKPNGMNDCDDLPVTVTIYSGHQAIKSYWKPSEQDIANILAGENVVLYVLGTGMPPVMLTVEP